MSAYREEVADLIVMGKCREAYDMLRDYWRLNSFDARKNLIDARNIPHTGPFPTEAEIDRKHDALWIGVSGDYDE